MTNQEAGVGQEPNVPGMKKRAVGLLRAVFLRALPLKLAVLLSALFIAYWGTLASDRYVSESHILIQRTDGGTTTGSGSVSITSLLSGGAGGGSNRQDQVLVYDYLQSAEVFNALNQKLKLFDHYNQPEVDWFSRPWPHETSNEMFFRYFKTRVTVAMDEYTGLVVIKAQAFDPKTARDIALMMVSLGENYLNDVARKMAEEQVAFLQKQADAMGERVIKARQELLRYQNSKNMVSPQANTETVMGIIGRLEGQVSELSAKRAALLGYLDPKSPSIVELDMQIAAVEEQMNHQRSRLTSDKGDTLNTSVEEYQRLQMAADFAQEVYKTSLSALERGRAEAIRQLKKATLIQAPTLPDFPLEPRRFYMSTVYVIITMLLAGVLQLMVAIIKDHQD